MSNVNTVISFEQLVQDFDSLFRHRVFRLETLDYYDAPNEHEPYARFLAGDPADWTWREPWKRIVRETRASGRIMQRVHIVSEPVTPYIRFELLHVYPANVEAGEDVRILSRSKITPTLRAAPDYWFFDDDRTAILLYDMQARIQRVKTASGSTGDLRLLNFLHGVRDEALKLAVPLAQYVAEHNITERMHAA